MAANYCPFCGRKSRALVRDGLKWLWAHVAGVNRASLALDACMLIAGIGIAAAFIGPPMVVEIARARAKDRAVAKAREEFSAASPVWAYMVRLMLEHEREGQRVAIIESYTQQRSAELKQHPLTPAQASAIYGVFQIGDYRRQAIAAINPYVQLEPLTTQAVER